MLPTPALDLIIDLADKSAKGRLALLGSRLLSSAISQSGSGSSHRIIRSDTGLCRVRAVTPNLSGERAFDYVDLSISTVRLALGVPGENPYCLATLADPLPSADSVISSVQSVSADLPATKRITLDPEPYGGHFLITLDDLDPFEVPFDASAEQIWSLTGKDYSVRKRAANAWEISGVEPGQDIAIDVDVSGLLVPKGVTGEIEINTVALAVAFAAAASGTPPAEPKWLRVYREVEIDGIKVFQNDDVEIAREVLNLTSLVPAPIPPSDYASLAALIAGKQTAHANLAAIAALTTQASGLGLLTKADAGAILTYISGQPLNSNLSAIANLATAFYGRSLLTSSSSSAARLLLVIDQLDNTSDVNKPVSLLQAAADTAIADAAAANDTVVANNASAALADAIDIVNAALDLKAPLASPAFSGTPTAPTPANATANTQLATTEFVHALIVDLIGGAPATLNAINELAAAIGSDPNFAATVAASIADRLEKTANLADLTNVAAARANLQLDEVDNTRDTDKPVSTAAQAALDLKSDAAVVGALAVEVGLKAVDAAVVHKTGPENIAGPKNFLDAAGFHALASNSIVGTVLTTPSAPVVTPIGADEDGAWSYRIVALLSDGAHTAAGPAGSTANGEQTLDATNKNSLTWPAVPGAHSYDVYRVAAAFSPATLGKIANVPTDAYTDEGAPGDGSSPPAFNNTGRVTGALFDNGGQVFNVKAAPFLAAGDGVTDDTAAVEAAIAACPEGGIIYFPPGTYRLPAGVVVSGKRDVRGAGRRNTFLSGDLATPFVLQLGFPFEGDANQFKGTVSNLRITRALITDPAVVPPVAGTMGISAEYLNYGVLQDVEISNHAIGLKTNKSWETKTLGLFLERTWIFDCLVQLWLRNIAETFIIHSNFGVNQTDAVTALNHIIFDGRVDDVRIVTTQFIPRVGPNETVVFKWINTPANNAGYYRFIDINAENQKILFQSDATALSVNDLMVVNSRLSLSADPPPSLFDFHPNTGLGQLCFFANAIYAQAGPHVLSGATKSRFVGNLINAGLEFDGGDWAILGNTFATSCTCSGDFSALAVIGNTFVYDEANDIQLNITSESANITSVGNIKDFGAPPPTIIPGYIKPVGAVPFTMKQVVGVCDGSGNASFPHGITAGHLKVLDVQGWSHPSPGDLAMRPMNRGVVDGSHISLTGGSANQTFRAIIFYSSDNDTNWG